ncbi:unnamed protein product [Pylaiella littoralis]
MSHLKAGHQCPRNNVSFTSSLLLYLVLGGNVPVCQPFGGFNSNSLNLRLRSCRMITTSCLTAAVAPRRRRRPRSCSGLSPLFLAAAAEAATPGEENNGHGGDVIAGSKQLESWKTSTARGSSSTSTGTSSTPALAPKRSNVMGRIKEAAEATIIRSVEGSGASDAEAEPLPPLSPPPPPPPRLQRGGGGAVHGEASPVWRVEATTTSEELLSCFKSALAARGPLMRKLSEEKTDCYRLFHGAVEGCPGLTIDRYSTVVLIQTFRDPPADFDAQAVEKICRLASDAMNAAETLPTAATATAKAPSQAATTAAEMIKFLPVWNDRRKRERRRGGGGGYDGPPPHKLSSGHEPLPEALGVKVGLENGVQYPLAARHRGIDPWLFLDLRAARKWVLANSEGKEVLNLFSYTGGVAAAAACGGAKSVWNVDFASSAHEIGKASLKLNAASASAWECECKWMKRDVLPTIRQLAGTPTKDYRQDRRGRNAKIAGGRHSRDGQQPWGGGRSRGGPRGERNVDGGYGRDRRGADEQQKNRKRGRGGEDGEAEEEKELKAKQFDVVFLDPPTWSKSKHGAVDLVRDYQTLFKPSLLATKDGGAIVATNHVSTVDCEEWVENLSKCATKAGRTVQSVQVLLPEDDFPSPDGRHPLKVAIVRV